MQKLDKKQKKELRRIIIAFVLFVVLAVMERAALLLSCVLFGDFYKWGYLAFWLVPYFIVGWDVVRKCALGVAHGQMMDECFLMTLATIGAFGCGEYSEAVAVMLFYQVGEFFQRYAVGKSRNSIQDLMSIAPDFANRIGDDGEVEVIDPDDIEIGDILLVKPGEKIPIDGVVVEGEGLVNTSALTGESMPQSVGIGDAVISGCINGDSLIKVQADREYDDSTVMQILELVENAASKKSKTEAFITRFARVYTPIVVACALVLAFIPPIFNGDYWVAFSVWMLRACTFLVISCPCALVISVPLAFFGGIGAASKIGVLVKGSNYLEMMANIGTIVSDKTGTLTEGKFKVAKVEAVGKSNTDEVLQIAAAIEAGSTHPIAVSICEAAAELDAKKTATKIKDLENISGKGMTAVMSRSKIAVGNAGLMELLEIELPAEKMLSGTVVYVAKNNKFIGAIELADEPKPEAKDAIAELFRQGVEHFVMLTGDSEEAAKRVATELGIREYKSQLLPQDKVATVEAYLVDSKEKKLAFIGDGINDAPVLSRADIGIAMGSLGSDAAIEAADIVIMDDKLQKIPMLVRIARQTVKISKTNIVFALFVKIACLILGALGIANMWVAVFADVGVAVICILNSMRMLRFKS